MGLTEVSVDEFVVLLRKKIHDRLKELKQEAYKLNYDVNFYQQMINFADRLPFNNIDYNEMYNYLTRDIFNKYTCKSVKLNDVIFTEIHTFSLRLKTFAHKQIIKSAPQCNGFVSSKISV